MEDGEYAKIEENYNWIFTHEGLSAESMIEYGAKIYEIDKYYNPYTKIEQMFTKVYQVASKNNCMSHPSLLKLAEKASEFLEKQNWKKDL